MRQPRSGRIPTDRSGGRTRPKGPASAGARRFRQPGSAGSSIAEYDGGVALR